MFRNTPTHAAVYSGGVAQFHQVRWKFHTDGEVNSSPAVVNGVIYFGSNDGNLYAVDEKTGQQKWKFAVRSRMPSSPAVANGMVYFSCYDGFFYAVTAATGELAWRFRMLGERRFAATHLHGFVPAGETMPDPFDVYLSSPLVWNGGVYFGSGDGNVYALDAYTGSLKWKFQTGDVVHTSPAISEGKVYIGSWDSYFYALDAETGKEIWRFKTEEDPEIHNQVGIQSSAVVSGGTVYFGCRDSNVYALEAATGRLKWSFSNKGSWVISSPVVYEGKIFFATSDTATLHVLDAGTGAPISEQRFKWPYFGSPAIAGKLLYLGGQDGKLLAIDLDTLKPVWIFQTDGSRQNLSTYSKQDGSPNYEAATRSLFYDDLIVSVDKLHTVGMILTSPVISGDVVYFGSTDGNLYALE
jgi:eukaryotic-like serine/threonine-protein kinase